MSEGMKVKNIEGSVGVLGKPVDLSGFGFEKNEEAAIFGLLDGVENRFGDGEAMEGEPRKYHNLLHSIAVVERASGMLSALLNKGYITKRQAFLGLLSAAGHDSEQDKGGKNEEESIEIIFGAAKGLNLDEIEKEEIAEAVLTTKVGGRLITNPDGSKTIDQINLHLKDGEGIKRSSYLAIVLAAADIMTAGSNADAFYEEGPKLREELLNLGIKMPDEAAWNRIQYDLAMGLQKRWDEIIKSFPGDVQEEIDKLCPDFKRSQNQAALRAGVPLKEVA